MTLAFMLNFVSFLSFENHLQFHFASSNILPDTELHKSLLNELSEKIHSNKTEANKSHNNWLIKISAFVNCGTVEILCIFGGVGKFCFHFPVLLDRRITSYITKSWYSSGNKDQQPEIELFYRYKNNS